MPYINYPTTTSVVSFVDVTAYGADPFGATASDSAIQDALKAAIGQPDGINLALYFPAGNYRIENNNVLGRIPSVPSVTGYSNMRWRLLVYGDGPGATILTMAPDQDGFGDMYLYDGEAVAKTTGTGVGATDPTYLALADLRIDAMSIAAHLPEDSITEPTSTDSINVFRIYGGQRIGNTPAGNIPEQSFVITNCFIEGVMPPPWVPAAYGETPAKTYDPDSRGSLMRRIFDLTGDQNASENRIFNCHIRNIESVLYSENQQAINLDMFGSDVTLSYGNVFHVKSGGAINVYGGAWVLDDSTAWLNRDAVDDLPLYEVWRPGLTVAANTKITYDGRRYESPTAGTIQSDATPPTWVGQNQTEADNYGRDWEMVEDGSIYLLKIDGSGTGGQSVPTVFNFHGTKFEARTNRMKYVGVYNATHPCEVNFYGCDIHVTEGGDRTSVEMTSNSRAKVLFDSCRMTSRPGTMPRPISALEPPIIERGEPIPPARSPAAIARRLLAA